MDVNLSRRFREVDLDLQVAGAGAAIEMTVVALAPPDPGLDDTFTELVYELLSDGQPPFSDGFESGDTSAWSATSPAPPAVVRPRGRQSPP